MKKTAIILYIFISALLIFSACDTDDITTTPALDPGVKIALTSISATSNQVEFHFKNRRSDSIGKYFISWTDGTNSNSTEILGTTLEYTVIGLAENTDYEIKITAQTISSTDLNDMTFNVTTPAAAEGTLNFNIISSNADLININNDSTANYLLIEDLDLSEFSTGFGWNPLNTFSGIFNGNGYVIKNLFINRRDAIGGCGLFSQMNGNIENLYLENVNITGGYTKTGGIAGISNGKIFNCHVSGKITGDEYVGGISGSSNEISNSSSTAGVYGYDYIGGITGSGGPIINSYATGTVNGNQYVGGLVGQLSGSLSHCHALGDVIGKDSVGGLVGFIFSTGPIENCYASGNVSGYNYTGGLIGSIRRANVSLSYASGSVNGYNCTGGFIGYVADQATIENCYARGNIAGDNAGGFIGKMNSTNPVIITNSYSTGQVSGSVNIGNGFFGGVTGASNLTINSSFFNNVNSDNGYGTGASLSNLKNEVTFTGWNFSTIWAISEDINNGYPYLLE